MTISRKMAHSEVLFYFWEAKCNSNLHGRLTIRCREIFCVQRGFPILNWPNFGQVIPESTLAIMTIFPKNVWMRSTFLLLSSEILVQFARALHQATEQALLYTMHFSGSNLDIWPRFDLEKFGDHGKFSEKWVNAKYFFTSDERNIGPIYMGVATNDRVGSSAYNAVFWF